MHRTVVDGVVPLSTVSGRAAFARVAQLGGVDAYMRIAECGAGSNGNSALRALVQSMNALAPRACCKTMRPPLWQSAETLDCCRPLELFDVRAAELDEFVCIARCQGLDATLNRARDDEASIGALRTAAAVLCAPGASPAVLIACYNRTTLGQSGDGAFFAPIGAFDVSGDRVLVLATAPRTQACWVDVLQLHRAMRSRDVVSGKARGWSVIAPGATQPLAFRLRALNAWGAERACAAWRQRFRSAALSSAEALSPGDALGFVHRQLGALSAEICAALYAAPRLGAICTDSERSHRAAIAALLRAIESTTAWALLAPSIHPALWEAIPTSAWCAGGGAARAAGGSAAGETPSPEITVSRRHMVAMFLLAFGGELLAGESDAWALTAAEARLVDLCAMPPVLAAEVRAVRRQLRCLIVLDRSRGGASSPARQ